ncbi:MAG: DEAD/DEAH box helicase [Planctomycetota bacterium]
MPLPEAPSDASPRLIELSGEAVHLPSAELREPLASAMELVADEHPAALALSPLPNAAVASVPSIGFAVKCYGALLPEGQALEQSPSQPRRSKPVANERRERKPRAARGRTRIRPPRDVVRLEDRLQYLLQPPLETLLAARSLRFPFSPFPYQLDGVAFLYPRRHAVLADEMGLGKTMQAVTSIRLLVHSGQARRVLLVCPKPLLTNWRRELATWAPELAVSTLDGPPDRRRQAWADPRAGVTLVGYETVVRDRDLLADPNHSPPFDLVLLDEAQRIKNPRGATSEAVCSLRRERSWALTGTPIENSTDDLAGIFEFVSPGMLRPGMTPSELRRAVSDSVLRRTKDRVLTDLPPKLVRDEHIDLSPQQWETYERAEQEGVIHLGELSAQSGDQGGGEIAIQHVFELVLRLKQICNFDPATGVSSKADRLEAELEECAASGRKAIVFSQWVETIERLAGRLERFGPLQFHGRVPHRRRDEVLHAFKHDPSHHVLLMSYGAGSVGLNLQFARYVFLFDRWWNPAVEDQAINRAHRIGAAGSVTVTRMISAGTIEQRIDEVLAQKRELFARVFEAGGGDTPASYGLTRGELLSLFDLRCPRGRVRDAT